MNTRADAYNHTHCSSLSLATSFTLVLYFNEASCSEGPDIQFGEKKTEQWVWVEENVNGIRILTLLTNATLTHTQVSKTWPGFVSESTQNPEKPWDESESASFRSSGWRQLLSFHGSEDSAKLTTWQRREQLTFWFWADSARLKCQFTSVEIHPASDKSLVAGWRITDPIDTAAAWILQTKKLQGCSKGHFTRLEHQMV